LEVKGHKSITDKISRVRLKAITKDAVKDAFMLDRVKELESELGALKAAEQLITEREIIDVQRVKAEIVRQVIDLLLSKRFAVVHDEAIDAKKRQEQDIDELCKSSGKNNKPVDKDLIRDLVKRNLISINHELIVQEEPGSKTRAQMAIDLSPENSKTLKQALDVGLIDEEHKQTLLFSGSLGRVKVAMLDLLYQHLERQLIEKNEHDTNKIEVELKLAGKTLTGEICGVEQTISDFKIAVEERMKDDEYEGVPEAWQANVKWDTKILFPPSTSTVEILEYAAREEKLLPEFTMDSLQVLYTGDY
jgi:DNA topoisomerase IA